VEVLSNIVLALAIIVAVIFSVLVLITGKGDAMSGGGSVRTTYKGKATFDDLMSRATLILGVSFMALVLVYNVVINRVEKQKRMGSIQAPVESTNKPSAPDIAPPATNSPATSAPATNSPAVNAPEVKAPETKSPEVNAPATNAPLVPPTGSSTPTSGATNAPVESNKPN
jgi:protein translocase SecG subunit